MITRNKTAEFHLPIFKQGDDLAFHMREEGDALDALLAYAQTLNFSATKVCQLSKYIGRGLEIEQADTHWIYVSGSEELIDTLIADELLTNAGYDDEGEEMADVDEVHSEQEKD